MLTLPPPIVHEYHVVGHKKKKSYSYDQEIVADILFEIDSLLRTIRNGGTRLKNPEVMMEQIDALLDIRDSITQEYGIAEEMD